MKTEKQRYPLVNGEEYPREVFPDVHETAHLVFMGKKGKIRAGCYFGDGTWKVFDLGLVPDDIADQGSGAVRAYGEKLMNELIDKEKSRRLSCKERIEKLRYEFDVFHEGVRIKGVLTKGEYRGPRDNRLVLTMSEPFQLRRLQAVMPCDFGSSMAGMRTFDADGNLLQQEIEGTEYTLIEMYKEEMRRQTKTSDHPALVGLPRHRFIEDDD